MEEKGFVIGEALRFGWRQFKLNAWFFILMMVFLGVVWFIPAIIGGLFKVAPNSLGSLVINVIQWVIGVIFSMGFVRSSLLCSSDEQPTFSKFFQAVPQFLSYVIAQIFYTVLVYFGVVFFLAQEPWGYFIGGILLLFPGIWFALRFFFYPYFVIDKKLGPINALKRSWEVTRGAEWDLLGLWFVSVIILLIGVICILVGLLVALPLLWIAYAHVYRTLVGHAKARGASIE